MATQTARYPPPRTDVCRHYAPRLYFVVARNRPLLSPEVSRVIGVIASPLLFWVVIGSGFGTSFRSGEARDSSTIWITSIPARSS